MALYSAVIINMWLSIFAGCPTGTSQCHCQSGNSHGKVLLFFLLCHFLSYSISTNHEQFSGNCSCLQQLLTSKSFRLDYIRSRNYDKSQNLLALPPKALATRDDSYLNWKKNELQESSQVEEVFAELPDISTRLAYRGRFVGLRN